MEENEFQDGTYLPRTTIRFSRKSQVMTIAATESVRSNFKNLEHSLFKFVITRVSTF